MNDHDWAVLESLARDSSYGRTTRIATVPAPCAITRRTADRLRRAGLVGIRRDVVTLTVGARNALAAHRNPPDV